MKQLHKLLIALTFVAAVGAAFAQPANDNFANRFVVTGIFISTNGSNVGATHEDSEPIWNNTFNNAHSVWYEWVALATAPVTITEGSGGVGTRAALGIFTGTSVNALFTVATANAPNGQTNAVISFTATAGTSYKIGADIRGGGVNSFSLVVSQAVTGPIVVITNPPSGQIFQAPTNITLSAIASNSTITNISFYYQGTNLIGASTNNPVSLVWSNLPAGTFPVTARAMDNAGRTGTSGPVSVTIRPVGYFSFQLVGSNSVAGSNSWWRYLDDGSDQGTAWRAWGFDDSSWAAGPGALGYGEVNRHATPNLSFGPDPNFKYTNYYFRHYFTVSGASFITNLVARVQRDDGVAVYLNGTEVMRNNLAAGANSTTLATANAADDGVTFFPTNINPILLSNGVNVLAAEIHQDAANSSDITFYLELTGEGVNGNPPPTVAITNPVSGAFLTAGANITISASASDSNGAVTNVTFYAGATNIGSVTNPPYTITWNNVPQGNYTLTAVATDNEGGSATSVGVPISVSTYLVVPVTLVSSGSVWKYLDNGSDQGTAWQGLGFNDSTWASGAAQLGYSTTQPENDEVTLLSYGPDINNKYTNYYFRHSFTVSNALAVSNLTIRLLRDDGAVVHINGAEVRRDNMPQGTITSTTTALIAIGGTDESTFFETTTNASLNTGANILAVEIHQQSGTSSDISFDIELVANTLVTIPPTNTAAPFVQSQSPAGGSTIGSLPSIQVTFSEPVTNVDAADLLVNGNAATTLSGGPTVYTFSGFAQPGLGTVSVTWAGSHGIVDKDPSPLPFDGAASSNTWSYSLQDLVAPTITSKTPAAGATVTNLTSIQVTFSENVAGVDASDMLINGSPAIGLTGSGANYTFSFAQPGAGTVNISWAGSHGITDTSPSANAFNGNGAGATWSYLLQALPTTLIPSNSVWRFVKGTNDTSNPGTAWRQLVFDDSTWPVMPWSNSPAPFYYGDPYGAGTVLNDMSNNYQCILLRKTFVIPTPSAVSNFIYRHQSDDGFVAWINGTEVLRFDMAGAPTDPPYISTGVQNANEPGGNGGAGYIFVTNTTGLSSLVTGTNVITVQAFNASLSGSSDFGFNLQFEATIFDSGAPRVASVIPSAGTVFALTNITVVFSEPVTGVDAADLLINGVAATNVTGGSSNTTYTFSFTQPAYGTVNITWASNPGITDFDPVPKVFDGTAPGATFSYSLLNPNAPTIFTQTPLAGATVNNLTQITVVFSKPVTGVDAADLRLNGVAATGLSGTGTNYTFTFPQPSYGIVSISWVTNHGIIDTDPAHDAFDATRAGSTWSYTLIDQTPPTIAAKNPPAGANVTNLTSISVTFSENVNGVNASDLLINGVAATGLGGSGANYTFTFAQPNTSVINISWAIGHGIADTAANAFDGNGAGATWQYFTPDNVPPVVSSINPPAGATVRNLTQVAVTFSEPVTGVNASDLLINNVPAQNVSGSSAGPYTFTFTQPATGAVEIIWAAASGITDLASPPNNFAGGEWTYILDPNAVFADKIVINEIMFQAPSKNTNDEWIELKNTDTAPINLSGWKITKGVDYTFPNISIPGGGYLVIAANTNSFHTKYPAVTNYVGPWTGDLANHDGDIKLETSLGETVDSLHYASEGDWATRIRGPLLNNHRGWIWRSPAADASGPSLELMNTAMPNQYGQNWDSSIATNGTPGAANSVATTNIPPMILEVAHFPVVPRSTDPVVISAKILDERTTGLSVTLFYRNASTITPPAFSTLTMFDDGAHNDGIAGDKIFAATIPAQPSETVIEFYVQAVDLEGNTNTWPAAARDQNNIAGQFANALYQVDDSVYSFPQPLYKLIMTETERRERRTIETVDTASNAEMNGTLITMDGTGTEFRYNIGIRERGAGSRGRVPANQRVNVPTDRRWKGQREFNLNTQYTHSQYAGYLLSRKAGLDTEFARIVRVTINNTNNANSGSPQFGCYIYLESPNSDMATAHWPLDDGGDVYRVATGTHAASLAYLGTSSGSYSNAGYSKVSNTSEDNWTDLIHLTDVLNNTADSNYVAAVQGVANIEQWMLYFAMNTLLVNMETSLGSGYGDDYGLYHAPREDRFYLIAHDWDTVLNEGDTAGSTTASLFRTNGPPVPTTLVRLLGRPEFQTIYYNTLRRLCTTTFSPAEVARTLDEGLTSFAGTANIAQMKQFATNRVAYVLSQLPADTNALNIAPTNYGGTLASNVVFASSNGTYFITSTLTIPSGFTLTIQPGVIVKINSGVNITVANGGRLLAQGTAAFPILFTRNGASGNWGNITVNGGVGSPETRLTHARLDFSVSNTNTPAIQVSGGTVFLDYLTFGSTGSPYIHVDNASFVISHCEFPTPTAPFEPVHGATPIKSGGRGLLYRNWFGKPNGYNDVVDFTGGNRPAGPIIQFIDNVFMGSDDDILDLDGTDAWVEGNIFFRSHRNGSPDSSSAVSGGNDSGNTSEVTIINNIFFDCDQAATAKQGNFYTFLNNTVVHQSSAGYDDAGVGAVLNFADTGIAAAAGSYIEGNILYDIERLTRNVTNATPLANAITFNNNLMPLSWFGPGTNNSTANPLFKHVPTLAETTNFTNWASAQIMRDWLSLLPGSPAAGAGALGANKGAGALGAMVAVNPGATTNDATIVVGINRTGNGIPTAGFPNGSGYTHYKWRLDGGAWSAETPIASALNIPGFKSGTHRLDVSGKRDSGTYQDDPDWAELALPTTVYNRSAQQVRFNEVLASNLNAVNHQGTHPDLIELFNPGSADLDISGLRLTDDASNPDKFIFDSDTFIPAGGYLVVYANNPDGTSGIHLGFNISKNGQSLYLYDTVDHGGVLIDSITFGLQATDYSIGRIGTNWTLCVPTFGDNTPTGPNIPATTGPATGLIINEIMAAELTSFPDDFVEIYNAQSLPVAMGGLFFTDNPNHWPNRSPVPALSFIEAGAYIAFRADGNLDAGADHLAFSLASEQGVVALLNTDYSVIDCYIYGPQTTDISQGRVVSNIYDNNVFTTPTPGAPNPGIISTNSGVVLNEILAANSTIRELDGSTPDWIELYNLSSTNIDLTDYSLSDDLSVPPAARKYVFTNGIIIPGNGYLRLRCDNSLPASSTNTGFNLKAEGGSVYLFNKLASGGALLNSVTYGLQAVDFSISRFPNGTGNWTLTIPTPGGASIPASLASASLVKVNEWMPNPNSGDDWFELWNPNPQPVAIGGYYTTDDLSQHTKSVIPALSYLGASTNGYQRFWADSNPSAGANHANFKLNNSTNGESIGFANPSGTLIDFINYTFPQANVSEGRFPDGSATIVRFPQTPSPNEANYLWLSNVVINEALTHSDPPFEDAIELRNLTGSSIDISNWWLSDSKGNLRKYRITNGLSIPANGFVVFYEYQFNYDPTNDPIRSFALSSAKGDQIYLSTGDTNGNLTGYRTTVDFGAAQNGVSFGRYVTSDSREEFVAMSARSFGQDDPGNIGQFRSGTGLPNPYPKVGPIVISQIMYHPPDNGTNDNTLDEFIELRNITGSSVPLYDLLATTNTWRFRDAVDFDFPQGVSIGGSSNLLIVSFDPVNNPGQLATFRSKYGIPSGVPVYGPYLGKLANSENKVELYKPDNPDAGFVPFVLVDRVHYHDVAPWPAAADGTGQDLQRVSLAGYGNDPTNWIAATPSFGGVVDTDGDGMPDWWEDLYGFNKNNPADANGDFDGDGMTNLQEYIAGTHPKQASSVLQIIRIEDLGTNNARLTFLAVSNRTYAVLYKKFLDDPSWNTLTNISAASSNRTLLINTFVPSTNRFFRLQTP